MPFPITRIIPKDKRVQIVVIAGLVIVSAIIAFAVLGRDGILTLLSMKDTVSAWCADNPILLFFAIAILPGLGFPASPLVILAGVVWGSTWQTCAITMAASGGHSFIRSDVALGCERERPAPQSRRRWEYQQGSSHGMTFSV